MVFAKTFLLRMYLLKFSIFRSSLVVDLMVDSKSVTKLLLLKSFLCIFLDDFFDGLVLVVDFGKVACLGTLVGLDVGNLTVDDEFREFSELVELLRLRA